MLIALRSRSPPPSLILAAVLQMNARKRKAVCWWLLTRAQDIPKDHPLNGIATSLSAVAGHRLSREDILASFCNELERLMKLSMDEVSAGRLCYSSHATGDPRVQRAGLYRGPDHPCPPLLPRGARLSLNTPHPHRRSIQLYYGFHLLC